jgi:hypothetical protein
MIMSAGTFNDLSNPGALYEYVDWLSQKYDFKTNPPRMPLVQARLPHGKVPGLQSYKCPVCGERFMNGMEVVRIDHYNVDKTRLYTQLLHILCTEKILNISRKERIHEGRDPSPVRYSLSSPSAILHTWHTMGRRMKGEPWEDILPSSIVRAYVEAHNLGLVKNVNEFLGEVE